MKKLVIFGVITLFLGLGFQAQPSQAIYTPIQGDMIKTANDSAVYYIGSDNKRHLYVNEVTFWTWYSGTWSNIQENGVTKTVRTISQEDLDNILVGSNVTAKPGMKLIKFSNSPRIYDIVSQAKLALVPNEDSAQLTFGDDWSQDVITIQNGFETDYTKDGVLDVTADWQDFASLSMHFELKFPDHWKSVIGNQPDTDYTFSISMSPESIPEDAIFIILLVDEIPSLGLTSNPNQEITRIENTTFKGIEAKKVFTKNLTVNEEWSNIYVEYDGIILKIGQPTINDSDFPFDNMYNNTIEEILNSFNFLN